MPSKMVTDREKASRVIQAAADEHAEDVAGLLTSELGPLVEPGENVPDVAKLMRLTGKLAQRPAPDGTPELLGKQTCDVFLNEHAYWANIPEAVWDYHIGGYQVLKKWLSYRERPLLGRAMKLDEVTYVTQVARRFAALILLQPDLDANYAAVKADTYAW